MDPALWAQLKAEQAAEREAYRQAEAERWADRIPVTDAELERAGTGRRTAGLLRRSS